MRAVRLADESAVSHVVYPRYLRGRLLMCARCARLVVATWSGADRGEGRR